MKPVSKTAYYCCGVRMMDAESMKPLVNDTYAKKLMGEDGLAYWEAFKNQINPNASNIARCYIIDSWIKEQLHTNPDTPVILIGAGLDSRAFRLPGGHWVELDEPGIIEYKNSKLPQSECSNPLQRISIDFENEKLADKLLPFVTGKPPIIVIEGVLMYLTHEQRQDLFNTLIRLFKKHTLLCDLMSEDFFQRFGKKGIHNELKKSGAIFKDLLKDPAQKIIDMGYRQVAMKSNPLTASEFGLLSIPRLIVKIFMKKKLMGYSSNQFIFNES